MTDIPISEGELICIDWGSSNFRAFLITADGTLIDAIYSNHGMLGISPTEFEPFLLKWLKHWPNLPIILAGMVGSLRGWHNTNYVTCPLNAKSLAVNLTHVQNNQNRNIAIIAGIENIGNALQYDVARGEETQAIGAISLIDDASQDESIFCLPGTHSKWFKIKNQKILNITTHMTGEIFNILTKHSILATDSPQIDTPSDDKIFQKGLQRAQTEGGLTHHIFSARTNMLKGVLEDYDINNYLSGILIGSELTEMLEILPACKHVYLIGSDKLNKKYSFALNHFGINCTLINGEKAAYLGMLQIAKQAKFI